MQKGFKIIGISTQTTNKGNQSSKDLGELWGRFYSENIMSKIPNKISNNIISVYTDYKSDYTDKYTSILEIPVSTLDQIPNGLIGREFKLEKFKKFITKGEIPKAVVDVWMEIWQKIKNSIENTLMILKSMEKNHKMERTQK